MTQENQGPQRGRPSQFATSSLENLPIKVTGFVLGDISTISREEFAEKIDECIVRNARQSKKCATNVAVALYIARATGIFRDSGYRSWEDYIKAKIVRHQSFSSSKQADRYAHAVQTWIVNQGYEPALLEKYGPSVLGEIAQAGMAQNTKDAQAWIRLLESRTPSEIRREIKSQRGMLEAPAGDTKKLHEFNPAAADEAPLAGKATPQAPQPQPQQTAEDDYDEEDEDVTDAEPVIRVPPGVTVYPSAADTAPAEPAPAPGVAMDDSLTIEIIEATEPGGRTYFTVFIRRGAEGTICERYTSYVRPKVREQTEADASEVGREKRNLRVEEELREALGN